MYSCRSSANGCGFDCGRQNQGQPKVPANSGNRLEPPHARRRQIAFLEILDRSSYSNERISNIDVLFELFSLASYIVISSLFVHLQFFLLVNKKNIKITLQLAWSIANPCTDTRQNEHCCNQTHTHAPLDTGCWALLIES